MASPKWREHENTKKDTAETKIHSMYDRISEWMFIDRMSGAWVCVCVYDCVRQIGDNFESWMLASKPTIQVQSKAKKEEEEEDRKKTNKKITEIWFENFIHDGNKHNVN